MMVYSVLDTRKLRGSVFGQQLEAKVQSATKQ